MALWVLRVQLLVRLSLLLVLRLSLLPFLPTLARREAVAYTFLDTHLPAPAHAPSFSFFRVVAGVSCHQESTAFLVLRFSLRLCHAHCLLPSAFSVLLFAVLALAELVELAALLVVRAAPFLELLMRRPFALVAYQQVASLRAGLQVALLLEACLQNLLAAPLPMAQTLALVQQVESVQQVVVLRAALLALRHAAFFGVFLPQFVSLFLRLLVLVAGCPGDSLHKNIRFPF